MRDKVFAHKTFPLDFILLLTLLLVLMLAGQTNIASGAGLFQSPPPAAPPAQPQEEPKDNKENNDHGPWGAVEGLVTDLSTGRPGAGLRVNIAGQVVRADSAGHYSLTGLAAQTLAVQLLLDAGAGVTAQEPIMVEVDGVHPERVDLGFYSILPTPTPAPAATPTPVRPLYLPETGGVLATD